MTSTPPADAPSARELLWRVPFSLYCVTAAYGWMIGTAIASVLAYPFRTPVEQSLWSARAFRKVLWFTRSRVTTTVSPTLDTSRPSVFCFNHVNMLDAHTACASLPQPFVGLMLAWHFKIPGYGWMMKATHGIPVHPASAGRTDELTAEARDRAAKGLSILVFPEGHRTLDGKVGPYKRGMFFMARNADMPVVPVAVRGMYEINRKGSVLFRPGDVSVYIGPQIETCGLDDEGISALAAAMSQRVAAYVSGEDVDGAGIAALADFGRNAPSGES